MRTSSIDNLRNISIQNQSKSVSPSLSISVTPINLLTEETFDQAAELLKTLAHPLRIRLIMLLTKKRSMNVTTLQRRLKVDQTILSYQLVRMRDRGLLDSVRQGKEIHYSLANSALSDLMQLVLTREISL